VGAAIDHKINGRHLYPMDGVFIISLHDAVPAFKRHIL